MRLGRVLATGLVGVVSVGLLAGCNAGALSKRELVVYFSQSATTAQRVATLDACAHATPAATPEPVTHDKYVSDQVGDIRFRIDHASDKQLAVLETCLQGRPGVQGVDIPDLTN